MANRKLRSAIRGSTEALDDVVNFLLEMKRQKEEKERQRIEDERADRKESRAVERLGMAREGHDYAMGAEDREKKAEEDRIYKEEQLPKWQGKHEVLKRTGELAGIQKEHEKGVSGLKGRDMALPSGVAPTSAHTKTFESPGNVQQVQDSATSMEVGIMKMNEMLGGKKKEDKEQEDLDRWFAQLRKDSPTAAKRMEALMHDLDVKSAEMAYPSPEEEADDKPPDEWYWKTIVNLLGTNDPQTNTFYSEEDIIRQLRLDPEQTMKYFGRTEGGVGQAEGGAMATAAVSPEKKPALSAEEQPAPMEPEYNPADHIPAGDTMPVAGSMGTPMGTPQDVESAIQEWIKSGRAVADIDVTKLARFYDMNETVVQSIIDKFVKTAP